jgi:hypothetical protein
LRRTAGAMTQSIEREDATGGVGGPCVGDGRCSQTKRKSFWRPAIPCLRAGAAPASPTFAHHCVSMTHGGGGFATRAT